jgi:hypothetical protein
MKIPFSSVLFVDKQESASSHWEGAQISFQ